MRVVLWINDKANQKALAGKIHAAFPIHTIVIESRRKTKTSGWLKLLNKSLVKLFLSSPAKAWNDLQKNYAQRFPKYPTTTILHVDNINSNEVYEATLKSKPDLIIVSGTSIIKKQLLSIEAPLGKMNLHTGLSPYMNGGPNCTNWCVCTGQLHLIGNSVLWLNEGIDAGNIITTQLTPLTGSESFSELHLKVMEHAHEIYLKAIDKVITGSAKNVPQKEIGTGKTYYMKDWGTEQVRLLIKNFKDFKREMSSVQLIEKRSKVKTVEL